MLWLRAGRSVELWQRTIPWTIPWASSGESGGYRAFFGGSRGHDHLGEALDSFKIWNACVKQKKAVLFFSAGSNSRKLAEFQPIVKVFGNLYEVSPNSVKFR